VAIAGRQWHLPINGLRSSSAAGQADRSSWDHRNWWTRPLAVTLPPGFGCEITARPSENKAAKAREENLWSVLLFFQR
jgi:hypothetical protein